MTIAERFGKRIRALRKSKKLSQEELAEKCGLHTTYIGQIERGEKNASLESIQKLSDGLGISVARIFETFRDEPEGEENTLIDEIYNHLYLLDDKVIRHIADLIKFLK